MHGIIPRVIGMRGKREDAACMGRARKRGPQTGKRGGKCAILDRLQYNCKAKGNGLEPTSLVKHSCVAGVDFALNNVCGWYCLAAAW